MQQQYIKTILFFILLTLPLWVLARTLTYRRLKPNNRFDVFKREFALGLLYFYFVGLVALTLLPYSKYTNDFPVGANVIPFVRGVTDLEDIIKTHTLRHMLPHLVENIGGNIILLIPVGFLFPICFKYFQSFKRVLIAGILISLSIEVLQWLSRFAGIYRSADIDDIILNASGTALGYLFYFVAVVKRFYVQDLSRRELTT